MLTPEQERRAEKIFEILLELPSTEREARIKGECGADSALAAEVRLLLAHYEAASRIFCRALPTTAFIFNRWRISDPMN